MIAIAQRSLSSEVAVVISLAVMSRSIGAY
jgi:hypothetical protein